MQTNTSKLPLSSEQACKGREIETSDAGDYLKNQQCRYRLADKPNETVCFYYYIVNE